MTSPGEVAFPPLVLSPRGALVGGLAEDVAHLLERLLHEGRTRLIVDLTSVDAIDGVGVQTLLNAQAVAHRLGGFLRLAAPSPAVRDGLVRAKYSPNSTPATSAWVMLPLAAEGCACHTHLHHGAG